jgi:hypothetical protein
MMRTRLPRERHGRLLNLIVRSVVKPARNGPPELAFLNLSRFFPKLQNQWYDVASMFRKRTTHSAAEELLGQLFASCDDDIDVGAGGVLYVTMSDVFGVVQELFRVSEKGLL